MSVEGKGNHDYCCSTIRYGPRHILYFPVDKLKGATMAVRVAAAAAAAVDGKPRKKLKVRKAGVSKQGRAGVFGLRIKQNRNMWTILVLPQARPPFL